jgi:hypothetical protein
MYKLITIDKINLIDMYQSLGVKVNTVNYKLKLLQMYV